MIKRIRLIFYGTMLPFILFGCSVLLPPLNPVMNEGRIVKPVTEQGKTVVFKHPMVWYNKMNPTMGILFPEGIYLLEAEDNEYYYFKAPNEFDCREFANGKTTGAHSMIGGLFISKKSLNMIPAGAYFTISDKKKYLVWKLGSDFLGMEGNDWEKHF